MVLILSGPSGSGKSTACVAVHRTIAQSGAPVGGVHCVAVFENGVKTGIEASLPGTRAHPIPLARLRAGFDPRGIPGTAGAAPGRRRVPVYDGAGPSRFFFGMWDFDDSALHAVDDAVAGFIELSEKEARADALPGRRPVVIVDEIGPLELEHGMGFTRTLAAIDRGVLCGEASAIDWIVTSRPEITSALQRRWPAARVAVPALPGDSKQREYWRRSDKARLAG